MLLLKQNFFVALSLMLAFSAAAASANETPVDPAQVIYDYYMAVNRQDCEAAVELRPGYSDESCGRIEAILDLQVSDNLLPESQEVAIFEIAVQLERSGSGTDTFAGLVTVVFNSEKWTIETSSFDSSASRGDYIERWGRQNSEFDTNTATPALDSGYLVQGAPIQSDRRRDEALAASLEPDEVVSAYYAAIGMDDCSLAIRYRPEYNRSSCDQIQAVENVSVEFVMEHSGVAVVRLEVDILRNDGLDAFSGFVALQRRGEEWVIVSSSYRSGADLSEYMSFLERRDLMNGNLNVSENDVVVASAPYEPRVMLNWWNGTSFPTSHGSQALLESCWTEAELAHTPGEEVPQGSGYLDRLDAPERLRPMIGIQAVSSQYRQSIRRVDTGGRKLIALTFDTGEQNNDLAGYDGEIVDYLRQHQIPATFYFGGKWMASHAERALQIIADPLFESGNHAWTHGNMRVLTGVDAVDQILYTQAQYELLREELLERDCAAHLPQADRQLVAEQIPTFRYPYGTCSDETLEMVNDFGLPAVQWSIVTADPVRAQEPSAIANAVLNEAEPGAIVIMHANGRGWNTAEALPLFIPELLERGYEFVTISDLLARGTPIAEDTCYEVRPNDNARYDEIFGRGTGD